MTGMGERKRIAFLCHPYHRGGVTRWMADAAIAFSEKGWETYFLTLEPSNTFYSGVGRETMLQLLSKVPNDIHIISQKAGRSFEFGTPAYRAHIFASLFLHLPLGTPVILSDDEAVWSAATSLHVSFPVIGVLHADEEHYYKLAKKYVDKTDALVCVSNRVHQTASHRLEGMQHAPIYTIPCGIKLPSFTCLVNTSGVLQLVYVGRITNYQKRVGDLAKIAEMLAADKVNFHMTIIGDGGQDKTELQNKIINAGLDKSVTFSGWLSQQAVAGVLNNSDILILTSDFEGTPVAMMEALASGCGIVGTQVSGIEDYADVPGSEDCYRVYNIGHVADAVSNVKALARVASQKRQLAARAIAETNFTMDVCLDRYNTVLSSIPPRNFLASSAFLSLNERLYSYFLSIARYMKMRFSWR